MPLYPPASATATSDATLTTTDITTNNASTSKHGFLKKLSNVSTEYMSGTGVFSTPSSGLAWILPESYGAVGDDSTDDTTAMQAWLTALNATGHGFAYLGGRYKVTAAIGSITVPCTIMGAGMAGNEIPGAAASFIHYAGTSAVVVLDVNSAGVSIHGLGGVQTGGSPSSGCTFIRAGNSTAADFMQVVNVSTSGFYDALDIVNGTAWTIDRCLFHGFKNYGAKVRYVSIPEGGDAHIANTHFDGETYSGQAGLHIESGGGLKVVNCKVNASASHPLTNGIELLVPTSLDITVFLFTGNSVEGWIGNGFLVTTTGSGTLRRVTLVGNEISSSQSAGHTAVGFVAASSTKIKEVVVVGNVFGDSGATVPACVFTNVDELTIGSNEWSGYSVEATFTTCTNVHDRTGGVAAGVQITGTPSSGQVPVASSGTAAAWSTAGSSLHQLLVSSTPSNPIVFADVLLTSDGTDFVYSS